MCKPCTLGRLPMVHDGRENPPAPSPRTGRRVARGSQASRDHIPRSDHPQGAAHAHMSRSGDRRPGYDVPRAPVAQWTERHRPKVRVGGSSPSGGATAATAMRTAPATGTPRGATAPNAMVDPYDIPPTPELWQVYGRHVARMLQLGPAFREEHCDAHFIVLSGAPTPPLTKRPCSGRQRSGTPQPSRRPSVTVASRRSLPFRPRCHGHVDRP